MFGDIVTDLAAALQGGREWQLGNHPNGISLSSRPRFGRPPIAGKNIANPMGSILTAAMMLEHLGLEKQAQAIERAVSKCVRKIRTTRDIGAIWELVR